MAFLFNWIYGVLNALGLYNKNAKILFLVCFQCFLAADSSLRACS